MDKHRMLLAGNNSQLIDEIFNGLLYKFEILSSSNRRQDRLNHIDFFDPHIFLICLENETDEEMKAYSDLKRKLTSMDVFTVVAGSSEKLSQFDKCTSQVADLSISLPTSTDVINNLLEMEITRIEGERAEQSFIQETLQQLKESQVKKHVLVIDDDPLMLKLIKEYLGDSYNVGTAINGKVARKFLESKETNLILLDYEMPEENGVEVLKKFREDARLSTIPVIFLTGVSDKGKLIDALSMKPQGYLLKPIDKEKLLGTIEKFIG